MIFSGQTRKQFDTDTCRITVNNCPLSRTDDCFREPLSIAYFQPPHQYRGGVGHHLQNCCVTGSIPGKSYSYDLSEAVWWVSWSQEMFSQHCGIARVLRFTSRKAFDN